MLARSSSDNIIISTTHKRLLKINELYQLVLPLFIAVVSNILTPHILKLFKAKLPKIEPDISDEITIPESGDSEERIEKIRAANRRKLVKSIARLVAYILMIYFVSASIYVPTQIYEILGDGFINKNLHLANTRLGWDIIINQDDLIKTAILLGIVLFFLYWFVAVRLANFAASIAYKYTRITEMKYLTFIIVGMLILSLIGAANIYYLLDPTSEYWFVLTLAFALCVGAIGWAAYS